MNTDEGRLVNRDELGKRFEVAHDAEAYRKRLHDTMLKNMKECGPNDIFAVGEEVTIKNSRFKIVTLGSKFMKLEVLPTFRENPTG